MKNRNENAKDQHWKTPVDLPHVKPEDYPASHRDSKDGTKGFSSQLAGHGKADHAGTSGFDAGPPDYTLPGHPSSNETAGQEEGGRKRQPTTSAVARTPKES